MQFDSSSRDLLLDRFGAVDFDDVPATVFVLPNVRHAVLAAAHEPQRVVGVLDAVHDVLVRLKLEDLLCLFATNQIDADHVVTAARCQEETAWTEGDAKNLSASPGLLDELARLRVEG